MILSYKELRKREVVNIADGTSFGKITDMKLEFPQGVLKGIVVTDRKNGGIFCLFRKNEIYIEDKNIVRIGGDVILVNIKGANCVEPKVIDMRTKNHSGYPSDNINSSDCFPPCPPKPCPPKPCPPPVRPCPPKPCPPMPCPPMPKNSSPSDFENVFNESDESFEDF